MSLKAFHIVFVTASTLLALGLSARSLSAYFSAEGGDRMDLVYGIASALAALALVVYGKYFLKKLQTESYL